MKFEVQLSKHALKSIRKGVISRKRLAALINKFLFWLQGIDTNIDAVKMTGRWKGFYRIRFRIFGLFFGQILMAGGYLSIELIPELMFIRDDFSLPYEVLF